MHGGGGLHRGVGLPRQQGKQKRAFRLHEKLQLGTQTRHGLGTGSPGTDLPRHRPRGSHPHRLQNISGPIRMLLDRRLLGENLLRRQGGLRNQGPRLQPRRRRPPATRHQEGHQNPRRTHGDQGRLQKFHGGR